MYANVNVEKFARSNEFLSKHENRNYKRFLVGIGRLHAKFNNRVPTNLEISLYLRMNRETSNRHIRTLVRNKAWPFVVGRNSEIHESIRQADYSEFEERVIAARLAKAHSAGAVVTEEVLDSSLKLIRGQERLT